MTSDLNDAAPTFLAHIIGQKIVVNQPQVALDTCFQDHRRFDGCLLVGPPGLGRRSLWLSSKRAWGRFPPGSLAELRDCPLMLLDATRGGIGIRFLPYEEKFSGLLRMLAETQKGEFYVTVKTD
ncbi:MAG: hypothetical protein ACLQNE_19245 [Thermoguttaceae bacterium]